MGRFYAFGFGVNKDKKKALYWYNQVDYEAEAKKMIKIIESGVDYDISKE